MYINTDIPYQRGLCILGPQSEDLSVMFILWRHLSIPEMGTVTAHPLPSILV